ncbi:prepilin peptidase [Vibrio lentus]|uniref:A24 family peptidase n=1 Tax=Vibrio lentus TaxID=136468 RepID=UPI000C853814|nr:prepilin peptidase [Vibrio lentus]PMI79653.1 hypothetical protein BCU36_18855 [Vibrio lentus]
MVLGYWWLIILAAISLSVMYEDIISRRISNFRCLLLLMVTLPVFLLHGQSISLFYSVGVVVIGVVLNKISVLGAGDSKLLAAYSLAIKPEYLYPILLLIICFGGLLSLGYYIFEKIKNTETVNQRGVPYGVPICLGSYLGVLASL